jgi:hypothetical protein
MLPRRSAERPQGILQAFDLGNPRAPHGHALGQPEVVEAMIERAACDRDAQLAHVGEVGQANLAGFVDVTPVELRPRSVTSPAKLSHLD